MKEKRKKRVNPYWYYDFMHKYREFIAALFWVSMLIVGIGRLINKVIEWLS